MNVDAAAIAGADVVAAAVGAASDADGFISAAVNVVAALL